MKLTTKWLGIVVAGACSALVGVMSQACTVTTGDGSFDSGPYPGNDGGDTSKADTAPPGDSCNSCLFQRCSGQWTFCQNSADCAQIYACATRPGISAADVTACFCNSPAGQKAYAALSTCDAVEMCGSCSTQCASSAPSCPARTFPTPAELACPNAADAGTEDAATANPDAAGAAADCGGCTASKCAAATDACKAGTPCESYTTCVAACQDSACITACGQQNAAGQQASATLAQCTFDSCAKECGL